MHYYSSILTVSALVYHGSCELALNPGFPSYSGHMLWFDRKSVVTVAAIITLIVYRLINIDIF